VSIEERAGNAGALGCKKKRSKERFFYAYLPRDDFD